MASGEKLIRQIMRRQRAAADEPFERYYVKIYTYVYRQTDVVDL